MPVPGRGRLVNEQMFGTSSMYRNIRARNSTAASSAISNYFFTPLFSQAINPNWPLTVTQVAFATDPFNNNVSQLWTDISTRVRSMDSSRGRQYELDLVSAGEAAMTLYDLDEAFNPTNPASPYYPNVKVYRRIIDQTMWPPTPVGGAVNTLNPTSGFDMTFESYLLGATPPWVLVFGGVSPVVDVNAFQGSQSLNWFCSNGGGLQGIVFNFNCIPGQVYTASVYLRQSGANVQELRINGHSAMATTKVVGQYVRLTGTFTADQPNLQLCIDSRAPTVNGTVNVDCIQIEPGNSASPFSSTGPVIYSVFGGVVERWPSSWNFHGTYGMAQITAVDAFAPMANQFLWTEVRNSILAKSPLYYWPLGEATGATKFAEVAGGGSPLVEVTVGPEAFKAGVANVIAGDPSGVGVFTGTTDITNPLPQTGSELMAPNFSGFGGSGSTWGITISWWMTYDQTFPNLIAGMVTLDQTTYPPVFFSVSDNAGAALQLLSAGVNGSLFVGPGSSFGDKKGHLWVATLSLSGGNATAALYVDGVSQGTATDTIVNVFGTATPTVNFTWLSHGGNYGADTSPYNFDNYDANSSFSHLAMWNRVLSPAEISDLVNAGKGYPNERSDQRVARYLGYRYIAPSSLEVGASTMGVSNLAASTSVLDACQNVTTSENGVFVVEPVGSGTVTFQARTHRYLETAAQWVFGEDASSQQYVDMFSRIVSGGFGVADGGQLWTVAQGSPSEFFTDGREAVISVAAVNVPREVVLNVSGANVDTRLDTISIPVVPTGANIDAGIAARRADSLNYVDARVFFTTSNTVTVAVRQVINGTETVSSFPTVTGATATTPIALRFQAIGSLLQAKAWPVGQAEPATWTVSMPTTVVGAGALSVRTTLEAGNTNVLPLPLSLDGFRWTFGSGEIPYLDTLTYDFDPTQVYNDVQVTRSGGIASVGGTPAQIAASQLSYGKRSYQRTVDVVSDLEALDAANWLFAGHQTSSQRISQLVINPAANPAIWAAALGVKISDRVTVKRRTSAGYTASADYFIERIEHSRNDTGQWQVTYQMSPANGGFNLQPWLLADNTFGVLGTTTVLGY